LGRGGVGSSDRGEGVFRTDAPGTGVLVRNGDPKGEYSSRAERLNSSLSIELISPFSCYLLLGEFSLFMNKIIETFPIICVDDGSYLTITLAFGDLSHRFVVQLIGIHDIL